ncbi:MAG: dimethyl sulfoxide reductase anchor subunit [Coriobacteriales bacterium]|jgi:anaerobic dimethyl sulfoxide reductase subunit C (anchor subunit)|nr:dimethyl sulfoxide reductase anchor subunit [Coriobacteriales bacterium]
MAVEWPLLLFTIIAGAGAGILAFAGLGEFLGASRKSRFVAAIISLTLLVVGGLASLPHLENPANFMSAATNLFSFSPISLELIFLGLCAIVAIVYLVVVNREGSASKTVGIIGIVCGVVFAYVSGHGYEVIAVRAAWATPALTLSYLLSALTLGGFLFLTMQVALKDDATCAKKLVLVVLVVAALQTVLYVVYAATAPLEGAAMIMWLGGVVVGGVIAVVAGLLVWMKNMGTMVYLGALAALIGGISFRVVMWLAAAPYIPGFFDLAAQNGGLFPF